MKSKTKKRRLYYWVGLFSLICVALTIEFQACGVSQPQGSSTHVVMQENSAFDHAGTKENCATCHQGDITDTHRRTDGRDCSACHVATAWLPGDFQLDGPGHQPKANECVLCHEFERPSVAQFPDGQGIVAGHYGQMDCINCHQPPVPSFDFQHVNATKQPITFCLPCHQAVGAAAHPAQATYFAGAGTCQTCHTSPSGWKQ